MTEENIKRLDESIHTLYEDLVDKPLQVFNIFNDFFGEDNVDIQGIISEEDFKSWIKEKSVNFYISNTWGEYAGNTIIELPQDKFDEALSLLSNRHIREIINLTSKPVFILVHFPHVRVTNENNRYVDINHLWAKVKITYFGTILDKKFTLNRSEYPATHYISNYLHSHIARIPEEDFTAFQTPCTGDGPINSTICSLTREFDTDLWQLFCLELSKFVTVESIKGVPYKYLEKIGTESMYTETNSFIVVTRPHNNYYIRDKEELKDFIRYFIQGNHLKFNYKNNSYSIGISFIEYIVLISNEYIKWYNEQFNNGHISTSFEVLKKENIIQECIINNGKIYYNICSRDNFTYLYDNIGKKICDFKGKVITLNITGISELNNNNTSIILNPQIALFILNQILKVLNYRYGRNTAIHSKLQTGTEVRYL